MLLLESSASSGEIGTDEAQKLKEEVLRRTAEFNSRLLEHERITDPASILVVPAGSLPRTSVSCNSICSRADISKSTHHLISQEKGNIR